MNQSIAPNLIIFANIYIYVGIIKYLLIFFLLSFRSHFFSTCKKNLEKCLILNEMKWIKSNPRISNGESREMNKKYNTNTRTWIKMQKLQYIKLTGLDWNYHHWDRKSKFCITKQINTMRKRVRVCVCVW